MKKLFHIREQLAKRRGNQFYRDRSIRETSTLCGESVTAYDVQFNSKIASLPGFQCCGRCLIIKQQQEVGKRIDRRRCVALGDKVRTY